MNNLICYICISPLHDEWHILPDKFISNIDLKRIRLEHHRRLIQNGNNR